MPKFEVNVWWQCARSVVVEADSADDINDECVALECGTTLGDIDVGKDYVCGSFEITPGEELK